MDISAKFELIDNISSKLEQMAEAGQKMLDGWQESLDAINSSFDALEEKMSSVSGTLDEMSSSIDEMTNNFDNLSNSVDDYRSATEDMTDASEEATGSMDDLVISMDEYANIADYTATVLEEVDGSMNEMDVTITGLSESINGMESGMSNLSDSMKELSSNSSEAGKEMGESFEQGKIGIQQLAEAYIIAQLAQKMEELGKQALQMADEFNEAQTTIVEATGATGEALDSLMTSATNVYSNTEYGLSEVATAVGEINTRMGLTGTALDKTTTQFETFAEVTGGNVKSSVRSVTQLMTQWGVETSDMASLMDKLTYAGQATGISVSSLTSQLVTQHGTLSQLGFSLDEAIAMLGKFELAGTRSQSVIMGFRMALSKGAITSLEDLYDVFDKITTGEMSAADAASMFGSRAGVEIVNAVKTGALSLDEMVASLENCTGVMNTTEQAGQTMSENWAAATNSISSAFQTTLSPAIEKISNGFAGFVKDIGDWLNQNPAVVKAISAVAVGIGVVVTAITAVAVAIKIVIPLIESAMTALGPIGWIPIAIGAVVTAFAAWAAMSDEVSDATLEMTSTTKKNYEEMNRLEEEYQNACETYGEFSDEASEVRQALNEATEAYEQNAQTMEESKQKYEENIQKHQDFISKLDEEREAAKNSGLDNLALVSKLEELASKTDLTAGETEQMRVIYEKLQQTMDGLDEPFEQFLKHADKSAQSVKELAKAEAERLIQEQQYQEYVDLLLKEENNRNQLKAANEEYLNSWERLNAANKQYEDFLKECEEKNIDPNSVMDVEKGTYYMVEYTEQIHAAQEAVDQATAQQEGYEEALMDTCNRINEIEDAYEDQASANEESNKQMEEAQEKAQEMYDAYDATISIMDEYSGEIQTLVDNYETFKSTMQSTMDSQFGLLDSAPSHIMNAETGIMELSAEWKNSCDEMVTNTQTALDTQLAYWQNYSSNLDILSTITAEQLGISQENYDLLMANVQAGDEQAVQMAQGLVDAYTSGNEEVLTNMANTLGEIDSAKEEISSKTADWATGFTEGLDEVKEKMNTAVTEMDLSDKAQGAAQRTFNAYIEEVKNGGSTAIQSSEEIANNVLERLALSAGPSGYEMMSGYISSINAEGNAAIAAAQSVYNNIKSVFATPISAVINTSSAVTQSWTGSLNTPDVFMAGERGRELVVTHANGTTYGEDYYIAGENGPELITGIPGSTVFPASETEKIIGALGEEWSQYRNAASLESGDTKIVLPSGENAATPNRNTENNDKKITIDVSGSGSIVVDRNVDKNSVLEVLQNNMKPILMNLIQQEIYEEGKYSYEY